MRILLSAFACAPNVGSENGVGWRWALELAKDHQVVVVTDVTRRAAIEREGLAAVLPNLHWCYFRPRWLEGVPLNATTAQLVYTLWQFGLLSRAKQLHRENRFDLAIHLTYGVFRHPSFLGYLGIPFVFGPLGGGEEAPLRLKRSITGREKTKELLRTCVNAIARVDPFLWLAFRKASLILVKTEQTRQALPAAFRRRAVIYQEIGIDVPEAVKPSVRLPGEPLRALFAGRLLGWKGVHLAIRGVAEALRRGVFCHLTLVGRGPFESELRRTAMDLGVERAVQWINHLPQGKLFELYGGMHCLIFPSLHDSSGNVVLEAQAYGLPVVCLDLGGPATLVTADTGIVVATAGVSEDELVGRLADSLQALADDEHYRREMGRKAIDHARTLTWTRRVSGAVDLARRSMLAGNRA